MTLAKPQCPSEVTLPGVGDEASTCVWGTHLSNSEEALRMPGGQPQDRTLGPRAACLSFPREVKRGLGTASLPRQMVTGISSEVGWQSPLVWE